METFLISIVYAVFFSLLGIGLMYAVYRFFYFLFKIDIQKEITSGNRSAALFIAGIYISISVIIALAVFIQVK
ncbi:MAG: hypothetical protein A2096_08530 [Spirochaetes bacterium GWF1_41_5]|nr:MAG: hypothetical protein A2096_08530 [Spirochaetes bacterium GWF1_41_5]HBE03193.1 hypothetical protein [Spirochaetia bacterium]